MDSKVKIVKGVLVAPLLRLVWARGRRGSKHPTYAADAAHASPPDLRNRMGSPLRGKGWYASSPYLFSAPSAACGANAHAGRGVPIDVIVTRSSVARAA